MFRNAKHEKRRRRRRRRRRQRPTRPKFDAIFKNAIARNETDGQTDEDSALADSGNFENTSSVELLGAQRTWLRHQDHKKQV